MQRSCLPCRSKQSIINAKLVLTKIKQRRLHTVAGNLRSRAGKIHGRNRILTAAAVSIENRLVQSNCRTPHLLGLEAGFRRICRDERRRLIVLSIENQREAEEIGLRLAELSRHAAVLNNKGRQCAEITASWRRSAFAAARGLAEAELEESSSVRHILKLRASGKTGGLPEARLGPIDSAEGAYG